MGNTFNVVPEQLSAAAGVLRHLADDVSPGVANDQQQPADIGKVITTKSDQPPARTAAFVAGMDEQRDSYANAMGQTCQTVGVVADALADTSKRYLAAEESILQIARSMFGDER